MTAVTFPAGFEDLAPWSEWVLHGERARYDKRIGCTMAELQAFYDAVFPRLEAACEYLEGYALEDLPQEGINLLWLMCSLVTVSFPVECWRQPRVPDAGASSIDAVFEPAI
ncbi:MAG: hypothetical protein ACKOA9_10930 [Actinomycetota bacterium]